MSIIGSWLTSCFYLANSRQMQPTYEEIKAKAVVFTLQTAGRCNNYFDEDLVVEVVFTLQTAGRCNVPQDLEKVKDVVFTLQTAGRCNNGFPL